MTILGFEPNKPINQQTNKPTNQTNDLKIMSLGTLYCQYIN